MKKKWREIDEVVKMVHELPQKLKQYDKIMKEKPNFDKSKQKGGTKVMKVKKPQDRQKMFNQYMICKIILGQRMKEIMYCLF